MIKIIHDVIVTIEGDPIPKGRPRVTKSGHAFTPKRTRDYEKKAAQAIWYAAHGLNTIPAGVPVYAIIEAVRKRPKAMRVGLRERCTKRPDVDNIIKAVLDAMGKAGVVADDSQVCHIEASSWYGSTDEEPHVVLRYGVINTGAEDWRIW